VHSRQATDLAEDSVVGAGDAAQQVGDRDADGDQDTVEDVEGKNTAQRADRQDELAAAEAGDSAKLSQVDDFDRGIDDESAEGRVRKSFQ
jgi:hypothetical protein